MKSVMELYFTDEELQEGFNCGPKSVAIYHQRMRTIAGILNECSTEIRESFKFSVSDFMFKPNEVIDKLEAAINPKTGTSFAANTRHGWYDLIARLYALLLNLEWASKSTVGLALYAKKIAVLEAEYQNRPKDTISSVSEETIRSRLKSCAEDGSLPEYDIRSVLIALYLEVPARDDFQLRLIYKIEQIDEDSDENYLFADKSDGTLKVIIRRSKNVGPSKKQQPRTYTLSDELTIQIAKFVRRLSRSQWKYPFGQAKHYKRIGEGLKILGVKDGHRSINLLRSVVTDKAKETNDPQIIGETAYKSLHTVATSTLYETK